MRSSLRSQPPDDLEALQPGDRSSSYVATTRPARPHGRGEARRRTRRPAPARLAGGDSSTTRASALPTITASAKPATQAACSGRLHAEADADRQVGHRAHARDQRRQLLRAASRGPPSRRGPTRSRGSRSASRAIVPDARRRRGRREQRDQVEPRRAQRGAQLARLLGRQVDAQQPSTPAAAASRASALDAVAEERVVVAEEHDRRVARSRRSSATSLEHARQRRAGRRARAPAERCSTGPSAIGSENGTPSSIRSAPASTAARTQRAA